jgi:hypothetical protein
MCGHAGTTCGDDVWGRTPERTPPPSGEPGAHPSTAHHTQPPPRAVNHPQPRPRCGGLDALGDRPGSGVGAPPCPSSAPQNATRKPWARAMGEMGPWGARARRGGRSCGTDSDEDRLPTLPPPLAPRRSRLTASIPCSRSSRSSGRRGGGEWWHVR